jgi:hypothetical protein
VNRKGFMFILIALAIFIVAITVITRNTQSPVDYSNEFVKINNTISNYEIILQARVQDCNWIDTTTIQNCIDSNSTLILSKLNNNSLTCTAQNFTINHTTATSKLNCREQINITTNEFEIDLNKNIILEKT